MFATSLFRRAARVTVLSLAVVSLADGQVADAASPSADGWQAPGLRKPTSSLPDNAWRLPNGQLVPASPESKQSTANTAPREPRVLTPAPNAKPITSTQTSAANHNTTTQKLSPSAAVTQTAAVVPTGRPAHNVIRPGQQQMGVQRVARAMPPKRGGITNPNIARMQRMNVAQNTGEWKGDSEDLPLPSVVAKPSNAPSASAPTDASDPFGSDPEGYYVDGDQPYFEGGPGFPDGGCCDEGCGPGECCCGEEGCCGECCEPTCGCDCGDGECCQQCINDCCSIGPGDNESCNSVRIRVPRWQELAIFGGVQGFKNPYDIDRDRGNFGFHEGFNAGFKIPYTYIGYQVGYQAAQSQINGVEDPNGSPESHTQHFTTFGLYRRSKDGLQFGSAWDTLVDRRHNTRTFHQIRSEVSWLDNCTHEFGFSATVGIMDHEPERADNEEEEIINHSWEAADQYLLFYRVHGKRGGEGRFYAGFSDDSDGIIGSDMLLPVHDRWSVQTGFTYMIPDAVDGIDGSSEEAWNISLALVWHWDCRARSSHNNPFRPLFNVANNGYMIIDRRD